MTVGAATTTQLSKGDLMFLTISNKNNGTITLTYNAQYVDPDGSALTAPTSVNSNAAQSHLFVWTGSAMMEIMVAAAPSGGYGI